MQRPPRHPKHDKRRHTAWAGWNKGTQKPYPCDQPSSPLSASQPELLRKDAKPAPWIIFASKWHEKSQAKTRNREIQVSHRELETERRFEWFQSTQTRLMGLVDLPTHWGGARGVNGAAYMAVPWSVWDNIEQVQVREGEEKGPGSVRRRSPSPKVLVPPIWGGLPRVFHPITIRHGWWSTGCGLRVEDGPIWCTNRIRSGRDTLVP